MKIPEIPFHISGSHYAAMNTYIDELVAAAPRFVRKSEIGKSREGRSLLLLELTDFSTGGAEDKPAVFINANLHAHELSGPMAALYIARQLLANDLDLLENTTFYIVPRCNPDNAEQLLGNTDWCRSRWEYSHKCNTFHRKDMNGDGLVLEMRMESPMGDCCVDPENPYRLLPRTAKSRGPFYFHFPEGVFEHWDGTPRIMEEDGVPLDFNRNFPCGFDFTYAPCGNFPCNEPETYGLAQFLALHRNIFSVLDLHNGWGGILKPGKFEREDEEPLTRILQRAGDLTGYPLPEDGQQIAKADRNSNHGRPYGSLINHAYQDYGLIAMVIELGTLEQSAGIDPREPLDCEFSSDYNPWTRLLAYQQAHPEKRPVFHPWQKLQHPQLGKVEVGGIDWPALALPAKEELDKVCEAVYRFSRELAERKPLLKLVSFEKENLGSGIVRLRTILQNTGELPSNVTAPGLKSSWRKTPYLEMLPGKGVICLSRQQHYRLPHLRGWEVYYLEWFLKVVNDTNKPETVLRIEGGAGGNTSYAIPL